MLDGHLILRRGEQGGTILDMLSAGRLMRELLTRITDAHAPSPAIVATLPCYHGCCRVLGFLGRGAGDHPLGRLAPPIAGRHLFQRQPATSPRASWYAAAAAFIRAAIRFPKPKLGGWLPANVGRHLFHGQPG